MDGAPRLWVALMVIAWTSAATPARAQDEPDPDPAYVALEERAADAVAEGRLDDALVVFREMHALAPSAQTLWNLGRVHHDRGEYVTAIDYLARALDETRRPLDASERGEVESLRERALARTAQIDLVVRPDDATVLVDDVELAGRFVRLDPGEHTIRFEAQRHRPEARTLDVRGGEQRSLVVELEPVPAAAPDPVASRDITIAVRSEPEGLRLHLRPLGAGGMTEPSGPMTLVCEAPCERTVERGLYAAAVSPSDERVPALDPQPLELDADEELVLGYVDRSSDRTIRTVLGVAFLALAAGAAVSAVVLEVEQIPERGDWTIGLIAGGVLGAAVGGLWLFGAFDADAGTVRFATP